MLVLVGGLLGAGKTTLILSAARRLQAQGTRVALVTNDQGGGLVDTALARTVDVRVEEVAGGCFCCRFSDLLRAIDALDAVSPDVIFAEPVGSCLDLAATVLRPLLRDCPGRFRIAPLTVVVDPARARDVRSGRAPSELAYLFSQQLSEADIVCVTRLDEGGERPVLDGVAPLWVSARTGDGVDAWLDRVLGGSAGPARPAVHIDYGTYAAAEASLAWLNWQADLAFDEARSPALVVGPLADRLDESLARGGLRVAHVKLLDQADTGYLRVSLCGAGRAPSVDGHLDASPSRRHHLLVNARVVGDPAELLRIVEACLSPVAPFARVRTREAFRPAVPCPERRA